MGFFGNKPAYGAPTQMGGFGQPRPHIDRPGVFGGGQQRQNFGQPQSGWPGGPPPSLYTRSFSAHNQDPESGDPWAPNGMKMNDDYLKYYRNYDQFNQFVNKNPGAANMTWGKHDPTTMRLPQLWRVMDRRFNQLGQHQGGPTLPPGPAQTQQQAPYPGGIGPGMGGRGATVNGMGQGIEPFLQRILGMISPEGPMAGGAPQPRPRSIWDQ
jgi:hypothetical protein